MTLVPLVALWLALAGTPAAPEPSGLPALRVVSDAVLPPELNRAKDVRWATDRSIFLANGATGTSEIKLEPAVQQVRELIPGRFKPGGFSVAYQLALSPNYLVVARGAQQITWRTLEDPTRFEDYVEFIQAFDIWKDRLLIIGALRDEKGNFAPDGAIAWIGTLDKKLTNLKPLLYDSKGPTAPTMNACGNVHLGKTRFFADGSFAVLPGVQPGLYFFNRSGNLTKSVDTAALGIDSDCGRLTKAQWEQLAMNFPARMAWVNQRRTVDTMLVLRQGTGLVIRSVENHRVRWRLEVVNPEGKTVSYQIPINAPDEFFHLRGDVRAGKIVFVLFQTPPSDRNYAQPHLITALVPEG
jgi:hypothetical protein